MRLASEDIVITIANTPVVLHPSLRAAIRLAREHNGFGDVFLGVMNGRLEIMQELVREGTNSHAIAADFNLDIQYQGLGRVLARTQSALLAFTLALSGHDPEAKPSTPGSTMPILAYYERLFAIATGWLGWTPEQAWEATPAEIIAAKQGRTDLITDVLTAIFGSTEKTDATSYTADDFANIEKNGFDPAFDRAGLQALKQRHSV